MATTSEAFSTDEIAAYQEPGGSWTVELIGTVDSKRETITLHGVDIELVSEMGQPLKIRGIVHEGGSSGTLFRSYYR